MEDEDLNNSNNKEFINEEYENNYEEKDKENEVVKIQQKEIHKEKGKIKYIYIYQ